MTAASVMTYDSLVENIQSYLERNDTATLDKIPLFIMLAEQVIASKIKFLGNLTVNTSTMVASDAVIAKPARWHKTVSMNITVAGEREPVLLRKYEYLRNYCAGPHSNWGAEVLRRLRLFTNWLVAPTPNLAYAFEVIYYERVQPLDSSNQSNWFTAYAPQALLYGSLLQAMPFLKNDERIPMWQSQYEAIMTTLMEEDKLRVADRQAIAVDS
jgi:hypothetical protein